MEQQQQRSYSNTVTYGSTTGSREEMLKDWSLVFDDSEERLVLIQHHMKFFSESLMQDRPAYPFVLTYQQNIELGYLASNLQQASVYVSDSLKNISALQHQEVEEELKEEEEEELKEDEFQPVNPMNVASVNVHTLVGDDVRSKLNVKTSNIVFFQPTDTGMQCVAPSYPSQVPLADAGKKKNKNKNKK